MIRTLCLVLLAASSASAATLALPSFENAAAGLHAQVRALRAAQVKAASSDIGPRLDSMSWDLQRDENDARRLQSDLRFLLGRLRNGQPGDGRRGQDPYARMDLQRFIRDVAAVARDAQWRRDDLRALSSRAEKDPTLVGPATNLSKAARSLKSSTNWLLTDARFAYFDLIRAGFSFEAMDLDRSTRDLDGVAQDLSTDADALLAKVR